MTTMKKKNYMSPVVDMLDIKAPKLMAGSIVDTSSGDLNITIENPIPSDAGNAAAPGFDWGEELKSFMTLLMLLMMSLTISAQSVITKQPATVPDDGKTHGMKIYLSTGTTVEYDFDDLSHVTYLPGIGMKVYLKNETTSVDYLFSQMTKIDYLEDANANANWREFSMTDFKEAWRLEYPHLNANVSTTGNASNCQVIVKTTDNAENEADRFGITYSLEWDNAKWPTAGRATSCTKATRCRRRIVTTISRKTPRWLSLPYWMTTRTAVSHEDTFVRQQTASVPLSRTSRPSS